MITELVLAFLPLTLLLNDSLKLLHELIHKAFLQRTEGPRDESGVGDHVHGGSRLEDRHCAVEAVTLLLVSVN